MIAKYSGFKANTFTFITECQKLSPSFNVFKFFEAFSTVQVPMTEEKLAASFKYAGLDTTAWEYKRLSGYLLGFFNLDALRDYSSMVLAVGTKTFVSHLSELSQPTEEQGLRAGMAWVSGINDLGPKAKFDPSGFKNSMRVVDPVFNPENFVEKFVVSADMASDEDLMGVFEQCGLALTAQEYRNVIVSTCGGFGFHMQIFRSWWQFVTVWGADMYFDVIDDVVDENRSKNALVMTFLGRIYALGPNVQFNLRGFVAACKLVNPDFNLQVFCDNLRSISRLEEDSLHEAFVASGINLDQLSVEYSELLITLFGDYTLNMTAMRELHYLLKKLGSEWALVYMWALVDQRQQVEQSVLVFKQSIQDVKVSIQGETVSLRFTMRSFIEQCKNSQSGWHSDADNFDLRNLLDKLSKLPSQGDILEGLISVFKASGIYTTMAEYENLIGSIAGGDYTSGLVVFKMLIDFLRQWGMEWNMWIIWSLLDDKEHNEEEMMDFMMKVKEFGPEADFDLLLFI
ncbi:hypothetical protein HDU99_005874, partial [Rhizoclosmatium hyalinum]